MADAVNALDASVHEAMPTAMPADFSASLVAAPPQEQGATSLLGLGAHLHSLQDLVLVCCAEGSRLLTSASLLQQLSPTVLKDMLMVAQAPKGSTVRELPALDDSGSDWALLLKLAQLPESGWDTSTITWGQAMGLLHLVHKYDMGGFRQGAKQVLKALLQIGAQSSTRVSAAVSAQDLLGALTTFERLGMSDVAGMLTEAIKIRLKAARNPVTTVQSIGLQFVEQCGKWLAASRPRRWPSSTTHPPSALAQATTEPAAHPDSTEPSATCAGTQPPAQQNVMGPMPAQTAHHQPTVHSGAQPGPQPLGPSVQAPGPAKLGCGPALAGSEHCHSWSCETGELACQLLSSIIPLYHEVASSEADTRRQLFTAQTEVNRIKQKLLRAAPECCPVCLKLFSTLDDRNKHMRDTGH